MNANNPTEDTQKELRKYQLQLNDIINKRAKFLIHRLRQENFHHNNKSGKYLTNQITQNKEKTTISTIKDSAGNPTNSPQEINEIFRNFYAKLYSSDNDPRQEVIDSFFKDIKLPQLNIDQVNILDSPITERELSTAFNQ